MPDETPLWPSGVAGDQCWDEEDEYAGREPVPIGDVLDDLMPALEQRIRGVE